MRRTELYTTRNEEGISEKNRPVLFEAAFQYGNCTARADILIPLSQKGAGGWKIVEVKSSFVSSRNKYLFDIAYTMMVARVIFYFSIAFRLQHN